MRVSLTSFLLNRYIWKEINSYLENRHFLKLVCVEHSYRSLLRDVTEWHWTATQARVSVLMICTLTSSSSLRRLGTLTHSYIAILYDAVQCRSKVTSKKDFYKNESCVTSVETSWICSSLQRISRRVTWTLYTCPMYVIDLYDFNKNISFAFKC